MNRPEFLAEKYKDKVLAKTVGNLNYIFKLTGNSYKQEDLEHWARTSLWLTTIENPTMSTNQIIKHASKLCGQWIREDTKHLVNEEAYKYRKEKPDNKRPIVFKYQPEDYLIKNNFQEKIELESDLYNCLEYIFKEYGIHYGIWIILSSSQKKKSRNTAYGLSKELFNILNVKGDQTKIKWTLELLQSIVTQKDFIK